MFQPPAGFAAPSTPAPPPQQSAPPGEQPGEFTRFFEAPIGPMPQSPAVQQPLKPQAPGTAGANRVGEFTQIFGRGDIPQPATVTPPASAPGSSNATQAFAVPVPPPPQAYPPADYAPGAYPAPYAQAPYAQGGYDYNAYAQQPQAPQGPGSYTRMMASPAQLTFGQKPADASTPTPAAAEPSAFRTYLPLILGMAGVLIIVIVVIVILASRQS
jgi:hypothetical protein